MRCYWVIKCGGFVGCRKFDTEADAVDAAEVMTSLSGRMWTVDRIWYGGGDAK